MNIALLTLDDIDLIEGLCNSYGEDADMMRGAILSSVIEHARGSKAIPACQPLQSIVVELNKRYDERVERYEGA